MKPNLVLLSLTFILNGALHADDDIRIIRTPHHGEVPSVALDAGGVLHMTYGRGLPGNGYYVSSRDGGRSFTLPVQLNQHADTVTTGMERGPKLALGKNGVIHVAWLGHYKNGGGIFYTRSSDGGKTFTEQRNLLDTKTGCDNATVAADDAGNVWVLWTDGRLGNDVDNPTASPIFMAQSKDNGQTFSKNIPVRHDYPGRACGCCRLEARAGKDGNLYIAFRGGYKSIRDPYLLKGPKTDNNFKSVRVSADNWETGCPMSGIPFHVDPNGQVLVTWMSRDRVYWAMSTPRASSFGPRIPTLDADVQVQALPEIVSNRKGDVLLVWLTVNHVTWAIYNRRGHFSGQRGVAGEQIMRNKPAVFVDPEDNFHIVF